MISSVLGIRFLVVDGVCEGEQLEDAFVAAHPGASNNLYRWFIDEPIHDDGHTWVLSNQWGMNTEPTLGALLALVPGAAISYAAV